MDVNYKSIIFVVAAILLISLLCRCLGPTRRIEGFTQQQQQAKLINDSKHLNLLKMLWVLWSADTKGGSIDSISVQKLNSYYKSCNEKTDLENGTGNVCDKEVQMTTKDVNIVKLYEYLLNSKKMDYAKQLHDYVRLNGSTDIQNIVQSNHLLNSILWNSIPSKNTANSSHNNVPTVVVHNPSSTVQFAPPKQDFSQLFG